MKANSKYKSDATPIPRDKPLSYYKTLLQRHQSIKWASLIPVSAAHIIHSHKQFNIKRLSKSDASYIFGEILGNSYFIPNKNVDQMLKWMMHCWGQFKVTNLICKQAMPTPQINMGGTVSTSKADPKFPPTINNTVTPGTRISYYTSDQCFDEFEEVKYARIWTIVIENRHNQMAPFH
ncbi:hypothetical protein EGR_04569 [Echinococcus granulosus]|uniref:Uncharacterized protein n=1 Tax=Echinococcus granulosus TaxID=6210 RepID=W6UGC6_ECHGR|nr:hypothetical protein EGR_04569 [Echinococcus granulosus]EUB60550.1 hypothetical protein EGR_04569 [Echinococcus granulosus]